VVAVVVARQPRDPVDGPGVASLVVSLLIWSAIALVCFFVAWRLAGRPMVSALRETDGAGEGGE
jgi:hypothetical protein